MKSKFLRLHIKDFIKGLIIAMLTAILTFITQELQAGNEINILFFKRILLSSIIGFLSYIIKNLFTNSNDEILKTEQK